MIALVNDYDVVVIGVANMLEPYRDRIVIAELDTNRPVEDDVDVVLYDTFAQPESDQAEIEVLVEQPPRRTRRGLHLELPRGPDPRGPQARCQRLPVEGAAGPDLVAAIEAVHAGEVVISDPPRQSRSASGLDWPGRAEGLSDREAEILALITQGKSNADIAALTYLSPNTVKTYVRNLYRKIDVSSRTQAMRWGIRHGFDPDTDRIEHWRGGP